MEIRALGWLQLIRLGACAAFVLAIGLSGCSSVTPDTNPKTTADLRTVHDAVQYAIDEAQKSGIWDKTSAEQAHWQAACKSLKSAAEASCAVASRAAEDMCTDSCRTGGCSPYMQKVCESAVDGTAPDAVCTVGSGLSGKRANWCQSASGCSSSQQDAAKACAALKAVLLPRPKSATLTLTVEEARGANGSITLLVVTFGGGKTTTTTHTVTSTLQPRPREKDYGIGNLPPLPQATEISAESKKMASDLATLIASAVRAANGSYAPQASASEAAIGALPPLALSELKIDFELTIDKNGKLGLKKEWTGGVFGIGAEASGSAKRTNKLEIVYSKAD